MMDSRKKWVFCWVRSHDWKRLLVSFFMFTRSYRYSFPSCACRTTIITLNTLYPSISPLSLYTGKANLEVYLYHPNFASLLCFVFVFFLYSFPVAISISSGTPCAALALAFAFAPFKDVVYPNLHFQNIKVQILHVIILVWWFFSTVFYSNNLSTSNCICISVIRILLL